MIMDLLSVFVKITTVGFYRNIEKNFDKKYDGNKSKQKNSKN